MLDLWFDRVVKSRMQGKAYWVRYIDDFVVCFHYRSEALRLQEALCKRLKVWAFMEQSKTRLVEFGRFAERHAPKRGRRRPETLYFLGFTHYGARNRKGKFKVGCARRSHDFAAVFHRTDLMRRMRHLPVREQVINRNRVVRGHYAYWYRRAR